MSKPSIHVAEFPPEEVMRSPFTRIGYSLASDGKGYRVTFYRLPRDRREKPMSESRLYGRVWREGRVFSATLNQREHLGSRTRTLHSCLWKQFEIATQRAAIRNVCRECLLVMARTP